MSYRIAMTSLLALASAGACNCSSTSTTGGAQVAEPTAQAPETAATSPDAPTANVEPALPAVPPADPREPIIAALAEQLLQSQHLTARKIDDKVAEEAIGYYVERLDPAKLFLLKPQVEALRARATTLDDQLSDGQLTLARLGTAMLTRQRKMVAQMVAELTDKPLDLSNAESFESDPDKREFAGDEAALRDLWRRNLERQVLERMMRMERVLAARKELAEKAPDGKHQKGKDKRDTGAGEPSRDKASERATGQKTGENEKTQEDDEDEAIPDTDEGRQLKAQSDLQNAYASRFLRLSEPTALEAIETFLNAVAAVFGPHTLFMAPDDKANFDIHMTGSLEGIGAVLSEADHYIEVREIVPGGAAWRQGELAAGDLIMSVKQHEEKAVDVTDMRLTDVVKMIRGPKGTVVTLSVRKPDGRLTPITITRDVVVVEASYARGALLREKAGKRAIGYIYLPSFYGNTRRLGGAAPARNASQDVEALLAKFKARKVDTVMLDLRGNGGGLLSEATRMTGLFIGQGPVVQVRRSDGEVQVLRDEDPKVAFDGRLLVLVDRLSASASEIVAGALQDYGRALVVGTGPTHGKGTVQVLADLDRMVSRKPGPLGVFKLTTQQFFLVDGESTQQRGVLPDIVLPDPLAYVETGERFLDNPIPWNKIDALPHTPWPGAGWDADAVAVASSARVSENDAFARIKARTSYLEARRDDTLVPLALAAYRERDQAQDAALERFDDEEEDDAAQARLLVEPVRYRAPVADTPDEAAAEAAAARIEQWRKRLERDVFVSESLLIARSPS